MASNDISRQAAAATLSLRGREALKPPPEYLQIAFNAMTDAYEAHSNPTGYVDLSVAENRLSLPLVADAINRAPPIPPHFLTYDDMRGSERTRRAVAHLFSRFITRTPVDPDHLALNAGAGSTIDLLASMVCDPGDKVMITVPAYSGFERDVQARAGTELVFAQLDEKAGFPITLEALEATWLAHGGSNSGIRLLLVSSPNNPTGEVLSRTVLREIAHWAQKHAIHVIMDEVYALSVFSPATEFVSAAEVLEGQLGNYVHIVWSFSKDFCISGCRAGVLYTQNEALMGTFRGLTYFSSTSRHSQWAILNMIEDLDWVEDYVRESQSRLASGYANVSKLLGELGVPFVPSSAGFFLLVDFRKWMPSETPEAEEQLWRNLVANKVLLTPAKQMLSSNYGWFRCCFSTVPEEAVFVAAQRLRKVLADIPEITRV